jgi:hypothetical protein
MNGSGMWDAAVVVRAGHRSWLVAVLVVVAVAQPRLGPQLLGHDLDGGSSTARPQRSSCAAGADRGPRPRLPLARDSAACSAWSHHTITVKNDASCSRRLRHGHPEHGPGDPGLGVGDLGVVGEVAGEAHAGLRHGAALLGLVGRAVCPARGPGGRWTPWHAARPPGASGEANDVGPTGSGRRPWPAQEPGWLGGRLRLGVRACQHRPARSLHPGRGGRTRLHHESCLQLVPGRCPVAHSDEGVCIRRRHAVLDAARCRGTP